MANATGRGIQSVEVGGRILDALVQAGGAMMLKEIAERTALTPGQVHAYATSFKRLDLIVQDPHSGRYALGPLALRLGLARIGSYAPLHGAGAAVLALAEETGLMAALAVWGPRGPTVIQVRSGARPLNINMSMGTTLALTGSAAGWVFAAFDDRPEVGARVEAEIASGHQGQRDARLDRADVAAEAARVRAQGHALSRGEPIPNVDELAVPVLEPRGGLLGAIVLVGEAGEIDVAPGRPLLGRVAELAIGLVGRAA